MCPHPILCWDWWCAASEPADRSVYQSRQRTLYFWKDQRDRYYTAILHLYAYYKCWLAMGYVWQVIPTIFYMLVLNTT